MLRLSLLRPSPALLTFTELGRARAGRLVLITIATAFTLPACKRQVTEPATTPPTTAAAPAATKSTSSAQVPEPVRKVLGRWLRSDGGYVLELRNADPSGVLEAAYFNPKSIHVSRAIWMQGAEGFQVVVELNDVGYPGATYVLSHNPQTDQLVGKYNQPAMQQSFDIEFLRQPKP